MDLSLRNFFRKGNTLEQLLLVNVAVFVGVKLFETLLFLFKLPDDYYFTLLSNLALASDLRMLFHKPWTLITYMFMHEDFFHILFNMLWLYSFGRIFTEYLNNKQLLSTYIMGGLFGGLLYILAFNLFPAFSNSVNNSYAIGASAGVLAIVVATATLLPEFKINVFILGPVALKWIAVATVLIDLLSIKGDNAGGHLAHLGGALYGFLFISQYKKGKDLGKGLSNLLDFIRGLFKKKSKLKVAFKRPLTDEQYADQKKAREQQIDRILDKISKSGYDSLSREEKDTLFKASQDKK